MRPGSERAPPSCCPLHAWPADASTFGTHVNDVRVKKTAHTRLAAGDTIRFADRSKFRLSRVPITLHAPQLVLGARRGVARGGGGGEPLVAAAAALGLQIAAWGPDVTHVVVEEGAAVTAAVGSALLNGVPVVTASWLEELRSRRVWSGSLPAPEAHAPRTLQLQAPDGASARPGPRLELAGWQAPADDVLAGWTLVVRDEVSGSAGVVAALLKDITCDTQVVHQPREE
jgi:hypothetical protein